MNLENCKPDYDNVIYKMTTMVPVLEGPQTD